MAQCSRIEKKSGKLLERKDRKVIALELTNEKNERTNGDSDCHPVKHDIINKRKFNNAFALSDDSNYSLLNCMRGQTLGIT